MTAFGRWNDFCRDSGDRFSTIPVCNLFSQSHTRRGRGYGGCTLSGISLPNGRLTNLGVIILSFVSIILTLLLIYRSDRKRAAVGRREIQIFLAGYVLVSFCQIFSIEGFSLSSPVRLVFTAIHIGAVVATCWTLFLNAIIGYQILEDGTPFSLAAVSLSALIIFAGSGYIALDHGFGWTGFWDPSLYDQNVSYSLYIIYLLLPLIFIVVFFVLESIIVLKILEETKPMLYLGSAAVLFGIGQLFQFVISVHFCNRTNGKINGGMFEVFFTLLSVTMVWVFWFSITEDDWPPLPPDQKMEI